jgi:hypothetical protein
VHAELEFFYDITNTSGFVYVVIADHCRGISITEGNFLAFYKEDVSAASGVSVVTTTLLATRPTSPVPIVPVTCRPPDYTYGPTVAPTRPLYVAFGWRFSNGATGVNEIISFNATETRE